SRPRLAAASQRRGRANLFRASCAFGRAASLGRLAVRFDFPHHYGTFYTFPILAGHISLTPGFSWVWRRNQRRNRFNGLPQHSVETVETVPTCAGLIFTQLKLGVNEKATKSCSRSCEIWGPGG